MLKLPVCPYCEAEFLYRDVKKSRKTKKRKCPNCEKEFLVSCAQNRFLLDAVVFLLLFGADRFLLMIPGMNLLFLFVSTAIGVAAARLLVPFTVRYRSL